MKIKIEYTARIGTYFLLLCSIIAEKLHPSHRYVLPSLVRSVNVDVTPPSSGQCPS